jgi:hypothetical protein
MAKHRIRSKALRSFIPELFTLTPGNGSTFRTLVADPCPGRSVLEAADHCVCVACPVLKGERCALCPQYGCLPVLPMPLDIQEPIRGVVLFSPTGKHGAAGPGGDLQSGSHGVPHRSEGRARPPHPAVRGLHEEGIGSWAPPDAKQGTPSGKYGGWRAGLINPEGESDGRSGGRDRPPGG